LCLIGTLSTFATFVLLKISRSPIPNFWLRAKRYGQVYEKTTERKTTDERTAKG
jgi:hypothetical protein